MDDCKKIKNCRVCYVEIGQHDQNVICLKCREKMLNFSVNKPKSCEAKMQIDKISEEVTYQVRDKEGPDSGLGFIRVTITNNKTLYISNERGKGEFIFVDSKPEVVAAVGRMLIAASELVEDNG